jgi:hypothetical protein
MNILDQVPKIAFIFVIFAIIAGGYATNVLSCQMQQWLEVSIYSRHIIGVILFFFFIMMEGGWDFNEKVLNEAPVDWSQGNAIHSMIYAIIIYIFFTLIARGRLLPNMLLFSTLFIVYFINTQRRYLENRNRVKKDTSNKLIIFEKFLLASAAIIFVVGFIDYFIYKQRIYGSKFSLFKFMLGTVKCQFNGSNDLVETLKKKK